MQQYNAINVLTENVNSAPWHADVIFIKNAQLQ